MTRVRLAGHGWIDVLRPCFPSQVSVLYLFTSKLGNTNYWDYNSFLGGQITS